MIFIFYDFFLKAKLFILMTLWKRKEFAKKRLKKVNYKTFWSTKDNLIQSLKPGFIHSFKFGYIF